jgi:DNA-binding GntR family transcriptional regulator
VRPEEIASALRRAVHERTLPPGEYLNQDELARRFGVSRIPLREALRTLVGEGLIIMKPGLGAVIAELDVGEVKELYQLRLQLEPPLAPDIIDNVRRRDVSDLRALSESLAHLSAEGSPDWAAANYSFQRKLYEISGKRHAVRLVVQTLNLVEPYARLHLHRPQARAEADQQRAQIIAALEQGDEPTLVAVITRGIERTRDALVEMMPPPEPVG